MPIGFYLVASNKPVCLTCIQMTLRNTQMHMLVPVTFSWAASKQLKVPWRFTLSQFQLLCIKDITTFFKMPLVWLNIFRIEIETCWLYLLSCMQYDCLFFLNNEISDLLQGSGGRGGDCFRKSFSLSKSRLFIHSAHLYNFYSDMVQDSQVCSDFL